MIAVGIAIAAIQGLVHARSPAAWSPLPVQSRLLRDVEGQSSRRPGHARISVIAVLASLAVGALLIVLRVVSWLH